MKQNLRKIQLAEKVIVELGMGDGQGLQRLVEEFSGDRTIAYVGIEKDKILAQQARMRVKSQNVMIINSMFEKSLVLFCDQCIDLVVMVLPDPDYIDPINLEKWGPFYGQIIHSKLKDSGVLKVVTEIINDLLEPVSDATYSTQVNWLIDAFFNLGFSLLTMKDGPPIGYASFYLDKFGADPQRIRIVTLDFVKLKKVPSQLVLSNNCRQFSDYTSTVFP